MSSILFIVIEEGPPSSSSDTPYLKYLAELAGSPKTDTEPAHTPEPQSELRRESTAESGTKTGSRSSSKPTMKRKRSITSRSSTNLSATNGSTMSAESPLEAVFRAFAHFGEREHRKKGDKDGEHDGVLQAPVAPTHHLLEGSKFAKMMKDCKLVSTKSGFTSTDVDLIFVKSVKKGESKMNFEQFKTTAIPEVAKRKSLTEEAVVEKIVEAGGPTLNRTKTKSPADRSLNKTPPPAPPLEPIQEEVLIDLGTDLDTGLRKTFIAFATLGAHHTDDLAKSMNTTLDGAKFAKLCKDAQLIDLKSKGKEFSMIDVDLTFNKTVKKGERRITFGQFRDYALPMIGVKRKESPVEVATLISQCSGPVLTKLAPTADSSSRKHRSKTSSPPRSSAPPVEVSSPMLAKLAAASAEDDQDDVAGSLLGKLSDAAGNPPLSSVSPQPGRRSQSSKKKPKDFEDSVEVTTPAASPKKEYRSAEEAAQVIQKLAEERDKLRKERKAADKERKRRELAEAERIVEMKRREEEAVRADRENKMQERLDQLRQRKEARELEFLVGERRAKEVLTRKTLNDKFEEDYSRRCEQEEEERRRMLEERRQKLRQPVLVGVEEAERLLKENEAKKSRRAHEVQAQLEHAEATKPTPWHGNSYLRATEEYVRNKAVQDDQKHTAMYRHAKMQEFGKLVKHIANDKGQVPLPYSHARLNALTPVPQSRTPGFTPIGQVGQGQGGRASAPPTVGKEPKSIKDRVKMGNDFLRQAIKEKPPLPPGLKLNPLKNEVEEKKKKEHEQFVKRRKQGDQYLKELRDATGHVQPKPLEDVSEYLTEVKRLRHKANSIENKLSIKGVDLAGETEAMNTTMDLQTKSAMDIAGESDDVMECVRAKLQLLERIEKFEKPTGNEKKKKHQQEHF